MHQKRCYASVCLLDGKIYAMGGNNGHMRLNSCEVYCPETNQWTLIASLNRRRSDADACVHHGRIYITGIFHFQSIFSLRFISYKRLAAFTQVATMATRAYNPVKFTMLKKMNGQ